jgi:hypothetical protein
MEMRFVKVKMISGEKIEGLLVNEDKYHIYVQTTTNATEEELAEVERLMGKKYADFIRANPTQVLKLPKDEVVEVY